MEKRRTECTVAPEDAGRRLDVYLSSRFTYRSRAQWQKSISDGEILLDGRKTRSSRVLNTGEVILFEPQEGSLEEPPVPSDWKVLLETRDFIAVDKPGGLPVHPSGCYFEHTLQMMLSEKFGKTFHPVNRLDRETSGITLFASSSVASSKLSKLFSTENIHKEYVVIVHGAFPSGGIVAEGFLASDDASEVRKKRRYFPSSEAERVPSGGEKCKTFFRLIASDGKMSVVECLPSTGRLHQIRATLCSMGFPVVGDKLYGLDDTLFIRFAEDGLTEEDKSKLVLTRQALHACRLSFVSPFTGEKTEIVSPLPEDMKLLAEKISGMPLL